MSKAILSPDYIVLKKGDIKDCEYVDSSIGTRFNINIEKLLKGENDNGKGSKESRQKASKETSKEANKETKEVIGGKKTGTNKKELLEKLKKGGNVEMGKSIESVIKEIAKNNGKIFLTKESSYKMENTILHSEGEKPKHYFKSNGTGYANPSLVFASKTCGVMLKFCEFGKVDLSEIPEAKSDKQINVCKFRSRYIMQDGELRLNKLGVAFESEVNLPFLTKIDQDEEQIKFLKEKCKMTNPFIYRLTFEKNVKELEGDELLCGKDYLNFKDKEYHNQILKLVREIYSSNNIKDTFYDIKEEFKSLSDDEKKALREIAKVNLISGVSEETSEPSERDVIEVDLSGEGWGTGVSGKDMLSGVCSKVKTPNEFQQGLLNVDGAEELRKINEQVVMEGINDANYKKIEEYRQYSSKIVEEQKEYLARRVINGCYKGGYRTFMTKDKFEEKDSRGGKVYCKNGLQIKVKNIDINK